MDLFVNRYVGDEEDGKKQPQKKKLIKKLQDRAKEKAKLLKRKLPTTESDPVLKRRKKSKDSNVPAQVNGSCQVPQSTSTKVDMMRRKAPRKNRRAATQKRKNKSKASRAKTKAKAKKHIKNLAPIPNEIDGFTVIGEQKKTKNIKVHRVLPDWLAHPTVVSIDLHEDKVPLSEIHGLDDDITSRLVKNGVTHFFPVQQAVIPWQLDNVQRRFYRPRDLCVCSPTGSGKTLSFVLPIIQALKGRVVCSIRVLVVLPVVELALQVFHVFNTYVKGTDLKVELAVGHSSMEKEQKNLVCNRIGGFQSLVDILVTTPGRLVDHLQLTKGFSLDCLRFLVIDEADRMIYEIKHDWFALLMQFISKPSNINECSLWPQRSSSIDRSLMPLVAENCHRMKLMPQKLLFSATLSHDPEILHQLKLFKPHLCTAVVPKTDAKTDENGMGDEVKGDYVGKFITPKELKEYYVVVDLAVKPLVLVYFILKLKYTSILCFTNTIQEAHRLHILLASFKNIRVREFSSKQSAQVKKATLEEFTAGEVDILFSTDAIARGMDIENVHYVVLYEAPMHMESYVHRVGRTARAGASGTAITLLENHEQYKFLKINKKSRKEMIARMKVKEGFLSEWEDVYKSALDTLSNVIKVEKKRIESRN